MRKVLIGLAGAVVLLVAAALIVPGMIDWNGYKSQIAAQVKAATGRDLAIGGNLDLAVLPSPHLSAADVRFASIPGATEPAMVRLRTLDVQVRFLPLLGGRIEIASVTLVEPIIVLERLADGRENWILGPPAAAPAAATGAPPPMAAAPVTGLAGRAESFRLDSLRIEHGTVIWRDDAARSEERIEKVEADVQARSLAGPFQAKGSLSVRGVPLAMSLAIGRLAQDGAPAPVSLAVQLPAADAKAEISGTLAGPFATARLNGKIEASGSSLATLIAAAAGAGAAPSLPPLLAQPFALKARVTGSPQGGTVNDLDVEFGGAHASGDANVAIGQRVKIDGKLKVGQIDLARWLAAPSATLAPGPQPGGPQTDKDTAGAPSAQPSPPAAAAAAAPFALPAGVDGSLDVTVDAITYGGEAMQDVRLVAQLANGSVALKQASLRLPSGGEASLTGVLASKGGRPDFDGTLDARADNLRALLNWMKIDLDGVPADRLRKFALSARLRGDDRQLQILGAKISLDTSRIDAGVTLALRKRLAFGASVTVNQLNLDAYLPADSKAPAAKAAPPPPGKSGTAAPPAAAKVDGSPLAALGGFDANLRLQVGSLTFRRTPVRDLRFDGTLAQGTLTVRDASVANLAGTSARLNGTLTGFDRIPVFRGSFAADSNDVSGIMRIAGIEPPEAAAALGKVSLRGKADGGADHVRLDVALDLAGGKLTVDGTVDGLPANPRVDAKIGAEHADPAKLARALGMEMANGQKLGPLALAATLKGDAKAANASVDLKAFGGTLSVAGDASGYAAGAPSYNVAVKADYPSFNTLMQGIAPAYRPAGRNVGPVHVEAKLKGGPGGAELTGLQMQAGKAALSGGGRLALDGKRPKLVASLTGGAIDLNPFLPAESARSGAARSGPPIPGPGGGQSTTPAGGAHFSAEPFDLDALDDIDADLSVGADAIVWHNFRVDKPALKATLADGLLTVEQLAGRMFDGSFLMKGRLNGKGKPAVDGTVAVQKANVAKALFEAASFDVASGTLDFDMALNGSGASPRALVAALDGGGTLSVTNGVVKGFDLQAVSDRLKNIGGGLDILKLFGAAMGGGQTKFSSLAGTFKVDKGVLRTNDLTLTAQAGRGQATGYADLPRWNMDMTAEFSLTEHPKAPPFSMTARGPIDNPQRIFHVEKLQAYLLQRGVGTLLKKALPKAQQPAQPQQQPAQPQQQKPQRPEDILKGLLKGLGR